MRTHRTTSVRIAALRAALGPGPWSVRDLHALGWSQDQVDRAVRTGALLRVRRGVVAAPDRASLALDVVLRSLPAGAVISHDSAAGSQALWTPSRFDSLVHVTVPGGSERCDAGVRVQGSRLPAELVHLVDGLPMTRPGRTAMDLGRGRLLPDALLAVDGAARAIALASGSDRWSIRQRRVPAELHAAITAELEAAYRSVWGWPGTRVLRAALDVCDIASESAYESWSRGWVLMAGLPRPEVNVAVLGASGREYVGDLVWRDQRLISEADGQGKYGADSETRRRRMRAERAREDDLIAAGWRLVRWGSGEQGRALVERIARALGLRARVTA